jgi:hypothetical protein
VSQTVTRSISLSPDNSASLQIYAKQFDAGPYQLQFSKNGGANTICSSSITTSCSLLASDTLLGLTAGDQIVFTIHLGTGADLIEGATGANNCPNSATTTSYTYNVVAGANNVSIGFMGNAH